MAKKIERQPKTVHTVIHEFQKRFRDYSPETGDVWKWKGYEMMNRIEKWAKRWPTEVTICSCDDAFFAGSDLALIEHRTAKEYMGITVFYIPQCTGENPIEFFLYPAHRRGLVEILSKMGRKIGARRAEKW